MFKLLNPFGLHTYYYPKQVGCWEQACRNPCGSPATAAAAAAPSPTVAATCETWFAEEYCAAAY